MSIRVPLFFLTGILMAPFQRGLSQEAPLTMEEAIGVALVHNRALMGRQLAVEDARWALRVEQSAFAIHAGPRIEAGRRGGDETVDAGIQVRKEWDQGLQMQLDTGYSERRDGGDSGAYVRLRASQFLFRRAGELVNREPLRNADRNWLNAQRDVVLRQQQLVLEVVRAYESALQAERQAAADVRGMERRRVQLARTRAREAGGLATRLDTLRAELQAGEAELRVNSSREQVKRRREALVQLLGDQPRAFAPLTPPELIPRSTWAVETAVEVALNHRLDVARARDEIEDAARGVDIARRNQWPDLALTVEVDPLEPGAADEEWDFSGDRWFVGVTLQPDLSPLEEKAGVEQAENLRKRLELAWEQLRHDVRVEVRQVLRQEARTRAEYLQSNRNLDLAEKRLRLATARFRLGQTGSETVSDAEEALVRAESDALAARAEASVAGYELLSVLGTLVEPPHELAP